MNQQSKHINELMAQLRSKRLALLCGAGISIWPPANKPLADALRRELIRRIADLAGVEFPRQGERWASVPFESLVSRMGFGIEYLLSSIYSTERTGPNTWHRLIAGLMKRRFIDVVFTTNFDRLIEKALGRIGWHCPRDYLVVNNEQYQYRKEDVCDPPKPTLFHLHGTDEPWSMCITMAHMDDARAATLRLGPLITLLKSGMTLLVIGYSAQDPDFHLELGKLAMRHRRGTKVIQAVRIRDSAVLMDYSPFGCFQDYPGFTLLLETYHDLVNPLGDLLGSDWAAADSDMHEQQNRPKRELWRGLVGKWVKGLSPEAAQLIIQRLKNAEFRGDGIDDHGVVVILVGRDTVRIGGVALMVNTPAEGTSRFLSDCTSQRGALLAPELIRRFRALGYLAQSEIPRQADQGLAVNLCDEREREIATYLLRHITGERETHAYQTHPSYAAFLRKAERLLTSNAFLHALTHP